MPAYLRRPWFVVLIVNLIYLGVIFALNDADPKVFVELGTCFSQCAGEDGENCPADTTEGYDGQFTYYLARDFETAPPCLDVPAYRAQRILLPLLGFVLSVGQDALIPWVLVAVNLAALVIATALLESLFIAENASRWYVLTYGLFAGVVMAVRLSTNEPLAYGLVIAGIWLAQRERHRDAVLLFALAALAKETTGVFVAGYVLYLALHQRWSAAIRLALSVGLLFGAWQLYLYDWLGDFGIGSGGAKGTPFEIIPFGGVFKIWTEGSLAAFLLLGLLLVVPVVVLPSLWALRHTVGDLRDRRWTLYTCLLLVNAAVMPFVPFSTYREFLGMLRFIPGLVVMVALYAAEARQQRALLYSTLWIVLLLFVVSG